MARWPRRRTSPRPGIRDGYSGAALRYYDQRRKGLIDQHGEHRVEEWECVIGDHLATRTGHLPPLEALLLLSDIYRQGQWHENQRHARAAADDTTSIYSVELPITEPGHYTIWYDIEGPGRLRVNRIERTA